MLRVRCSRNREVQFRDQFQLLVMSFVGKQKSNLFIGKESACSVNRRNDVSVSRNYDHCIALIKKADFQQLRCNGHVRLFFFMSSDVLYTVWSTAFLLFETGKLNSNASIFQAFCIGSVSVFDIGHYIQKVLCDSGEVVNPADMGVISDVR